MAGVSISFLLCIIFLFPYHSLSFPLCTNSKVPFKLQAPLEFCQYNETSCCDSAEDTQLRKQFEVLNVSDPHCASLLQSILCAKCDQYSAELFGVGTTPTSVPLLCNSAVSVRYQSKADASVNFCTKVWDTCGNVSIDNSPFSRSAPRKSGLSPTRLIDEWQSKNDFCKAFGGTLDNVVCFDGKETTFIREEMMPIEGICVEKIGNGSYVSMAAHPDGSDNIFLTKQEGKIWLATVPKEGKNAALGIDESQPFLDISDQVLFQAKLGLLSTAFHPNFTENGRIFVSFNCNKLQHPECSGRCSCNADANCDPASLDIDNGILPCQYHNVIAEFSANNSGVENTAGVRSANPFEVKKLFKIGLPYHDGHAGQILFGPDDGYLYYLIGDASRINNNPYKFSQNKKSLLGKILRIDVDNLSSAKGDSSNLWGNYSVPKDNPYVDDKELLPEIWAMGFLNPWRCSFDSERSSYFLCGESGQALFEEVDLVTKGGNYGWPIYEGPYLHNQSNSAGSNAITNPIFPIMGYKDSDVSSKAGAASIIGGYFYRSKTDPCLYGRYLYTDVYANTIWVGTEQPQNSGNFTTVKMPWRCAKDSPLPCNTIPGSLNAAIGYAFSLGEDNQKDVYLLASSGVYRIAHPRRCNFTCSKDKQSDSQSQRPPYSSSSVRSIKFTILNHLLHLLVCYVGYYLVPNG